MKSRIFFSILTASTFAGCSFGGVRHADATAKAPPHSSDPVRSEANATGPATKDASASLEEQAASKSETQPETEKAHGVAPAPTPAKTETSQSVVSAETSLKWLKHGNTRFVKHNFRADGRSEKDRERLVKGQHPHAIILSCSDSRVPPEIVFDQSLGEIFVIRVAGEALDSSVIASVEYAVEHLHSSLLVVMGHSQCGAIQATVQTPEASSAGSPDLDKLINDIRPRLASLKSESKSGSGNGLGSPSTNLEVESVLNADGVARDLVKRSSILKNAVEQGTLVIKSALYRVDSGKVTFY